MAMNPSRPWNEIAHCEGTTSIATTPVAAQIICTNAGYLERVFASAAGTTTGTITVAVSLNGGSDLCNSLLLIPAGTGARAGASYEWPMNISVGQTTSPTYINEGDTITFTPSG